MSNQSYTDQEARERFHEFFQSEYQGLLHYAASLLTVKGDQGRAEEAVQEMFALAWERRDEVLSSEKPVGWLYNALHYKVKELMKVESRWSRRLLRYAQYYNPQPQAWLSLELELGDLIPREDFELLCRVYIQGYSYRELCQELGVKKSALAVRLHRIKQQILKQLLEK